MRSFDPRAVGGLETRAWETYYRRRWAAAAIAFVRLVRAAFGMSWRLTFEGAWYVLRANQKWAPYPDNDPDAARAYMARFYRLLKAAEGLDIDPVKASELERDGRLRPLGRGRQRPGGPAPERGAGPARAVVRGAARGGPLLARRQRSASGAL